MRRSDAAGDTGPHRPWLPIVAVLLGLAPLLGTAAAEYWPGDDEFAHPAAPGPEAIARIAPLPSPSGATTAPVAAARHGVVAQTLLDHRAAAIKQRDAVAFAATLDPAAAGFRRAQDAMFDSLRVVPYESWAYRLAELAPFALSADRQQELGADAFTARVTARYRLADYDHAPKHFDAYYTFVERDGSWYIASDSDGEDLGYPTHRQLWDLGTITVVRGARSIVLGIGERSALEQHARQADAAVLRVSEVWGTRWEQKVVVIVPDTQAHMAALLGADEDRYSQIAAITRAEAMQPAADGTADRVVVNPAIWRNLGDRGRRIVMTHEVAHVATRTSTTDVTPLWLSEGFADYVGYRGSGVARDVAASELIDVVRADGPPDALPSDADFDPRAKGLALAYQQAWLAATMIAIEHGEDDLVDFYREVGTPDGGEAENLEEAFRDVLGTTTAEFTAAWQSYVKELAP